MHSSLSRRLSSGYAYLAGERPSLNVPYAVLQAAPELQGGNVCNSGPTFINVSWCGLSAWCGLVAQSRSTPASKRCVL